jgi:hypothetical protein
MRFTQIEKSKLSFDFQKVKDSHQLKVEMRKVTAISKEMPSAAETVQGKSALGEKQYLFHLMQ